MDFNLLAEETMILSKNLSKTRVDIDKTCLTKETIQKSLFEKDFDDLHSPSIGPVICYWIEFGERTFYVRGQLEENCSSIDRFEITKKWKNINNNLKSEIHFFTVKSLELGQILIDQISNRRFFYNEDIICNISDPGENWWLSFGEGEINIYFKSLGNMAERNMFCLGPIGDHLIAERRWNQINNFFEVNFINPEINASDKGLHLKADDYNNSIFNDLLTLFKDGDNLFDRTDFEMLQDPETIFFYLEELANTRKWWIEIEKEIEQMLLKGLGHSNTLS